MDDNEYNDMVGKDNCLIVIDAKGIYTHYSNTIGPVNTQVSVCITGKLNAENTRTIGIEGKLTHLPNAGNATYRGRVNKEYVVMVLEPVKQ